MITVVQYERSRMAGVSGERWTRIGATSALIGGGLLALSGVAMHSALSVEQGTMAAPFLVAAMLLLVAGLPALYVSERRRFGTLAKTGFGLMAAGWIVAALSFPVANYGPGIVFLGFLFGLLVAMIGAFLFGVSILRSDEMTIPRLGAWLLVAALPVGLPFTVAFTEYVMGGVDSPWAGPMLLYGLAWIVLGTYLRTHREDAASVGALPQ